MASSDVLVDAFERIRDAVNPAVNDLSAEQLAFRPDGESNSIAWLVWHLTRIQDDDVAGLHRIEQAWTEGEKTVAYLPTLSDADLERVIDPSWDPPVTVGIRLVSVIADDLQHVGQAAYVRGVVQRLGDSAGR